MLVRTGARSLRISSSKRIPTWHVVQEENRAGATLLQEQNRQTPSQLIIPSTVVGFSVPENIHDAKSSVR